MGASPPKPVVDPVKRFARNRKVLQSPDRKGKQLPRTKTPHEQESLKRTITATSTQVGYSAAF